MKTTIDDLLDRLSRTVFNDPPAATHFSGIKPQKIDWAGWVQCSNSDCPCYYDQKKFMTCPRCEERAPRPIATLCFERYYQYPDGEDERAWWAVHPVFKLSAHTVVNADGKRRPSLRVQVGRFGLVLGWAY